MYSISSHVLDTSIGRPAEGILVTLEAKDGESWNSKSEHITDADGRIHSLGGLAAGIYKITFYTEAYFKDKGIETFYPEISVQARIGSEKMEESSKSKSESKSESEPESPPESSSRRNHYHIPLLLSPFGYSTYRGS